MQDAITAYDITESIIPSRALGHVPLQAGKVGSLVATSAKSAPDHSSPSRNGNDPSRHYHSALLRTSPCDIVLSHLQLFSHHISNILVKPDCLSENGHSINHGARRSSVFSHPFPPCQQPSHRTSNRTRSALVRCSSHLSAITYVSTADDGERTFCGAERAGQWGRRRARSAETTNDVVLEEHESQQTAKLRAS